ncbi:MAG: S-layer homology domain-containing protein [Oscillospiraceae bacterium]|jgi:hypothetical protein|nr:S-layer homology domain-containing protein [Oscillospiraceae bacterium]
MRNFYRIVVSVALALIIALSHGVAAFAKTLVSEKGENIFFYAVNAEDKAVLLKVIPLAELKKISHGRSGGGNYYISSTDNYPTTQYCEARGVTVPELVEYVKRVTDVKGADAIGFSGSDTIRLMATDSYGNYNRNWTYDELYGVPRYYFEGLYDGKIGWNTGWEIAGEDDSKFGVTLGEYNSKYKDADSFYENKRAVFATGVRTEPILATESFSGRTTSAALVASTEIGIAEQIEANGGKAAGSLKDMLEDTWSLRLSLPMTEADLMAAHRTAFDNFKWIYNIRLDMADAPELKSLGSVAEPVANVTVSGDTLTIAVSCETPGAKLYYSFDGAPQIPYTAPVTVDIKDRALASDPVTFYMTAVREGYDDAGVITVKYPGLAPAFKTLYSAMAGETLTFEVSGAVTQQMWSEWAAALNSVTLKKPGENGYRGVDSALWSADADGGTIAFDKSLFDEAGSYSFVFRAPSYADKSASVTIKKPAPRILSREKAKLGAPLVFRFDSADYQSGLTLYVTPPGGESVMIPTGRLDRNTPGRLVLSATYFESASGAVTAPGKYSFSFVNSRFEPGAAEVTVELIAAEIPALGDVNTEDWHYDAARYVISEGLFDLAPDGSFGADAPMTREMFAEALYRLAGTPEIGGGSPFSDTSAAGVKWAHDAGIIYGAGDGRFLPDGIITREQIAVLLYRYAKWTVDSGQWLVDGGTETLSRFSDADEVSNWARDAMLWATRAGIINGSDGRLTPQGTATRAQAAQLLLNY